VIDNVYGDEFLLVNSNPGYNPYINPTQPMSGMVRFNSNRMEAYDGSTWHNVGGGNAHIQLSPEAKEILAWAKKKMHEERQIEALAATNEDIAKASALAEIARQHVLDLVNDVLEKERVVEILSK